VRQGSGGSGHGPVSLSNRRETSAKSKDPVGVDRLSVSFPVVDHEPDLSAWSSVRTSNPGTDQAAETLTGFVRLDGGAQVMVGCQFVPATGAWVGKVEYNPARVVDPEGHSLATADQTLSTLEEVRILAGAFVQVNGPDWMHQRVRRMDTAKDFDGIGRPGALLAGLATVHRPWSRKNNLFNDSSRAGAQTLSVGGGQSGVNLYDKHAETKGAVAAGTLRWEARNRSGWLERYGEIKHVNDITTDRLEALAMNRFDWSGMGVEVTVADEVVERVLRSDLSGADQRGLLGWLLMASVGKESPMSSRTAAKYRAAARRLGIALDPAMFEGGEAFRARLDWETGTEVLRVA
jgi:hypothetical protein